MKNKYLTLLYNAIKEVCHDRHPYDDTLVGQIAEMFLELDKTVTVKREES